MIDGVIGGKLFGQPRQATGKNGQPFVTAKVRAAAGDGEVLFVSVITFSRTVGNGLMAMTDGDTVCLSGSITPKVWQDKEGVNRPGIDFLASVLLTPYHVRKKRAAVEMARNEGGGDE